MKYLLDFCVDCWYNFKLVVIDKIFNSLGYIPDLPEPDSEGLDVYVDNLKWVTIKKIVVPSKYDKDQLIRAFKYLHDNRFIDTDFMAVNTIVHMYQAPELIEIDD